MPRPRSRSRSPPRSRHNSNGDTGYRRPSPPSSRSGYSSRPRDSGSDRDRPVGRSNRYTSEDREKERANDRRRYDEKRDRSRSPSRTGSGPGGPVMAPPSPKREAPKPNFENSGLLAAETNTTATGAMLKYNEPPEARKPTLNWRLYVFKGKEQVDIFHIHRQSAYLVGRDSAVVDIPSAHPSCSKQHAVIQFRLIRTRNEFGDESSSVKPFVIDLDSTNATFVNDQEIPPSRYYELKASDVLKFGQSTREFVLLHEEAA
ncbi:Transcriptional regulator SNIP1, contains FHA domain [Phaffia rhodozyma]|uniref:Transcriptional regulator SNIP1, contains FHA domain n=1 Tax=Phaffia rhodozyma TaxID=264483 RepID=A0A0F7SWK2_PHARH|nr:Transcriptional regulator SNIP1, contains FHA domain [Phaffia rhodozyma]